MRLKSKETATLAVGATETGIIDFGQGTPVGLIVAGSSLSANTLTFKVSNDNTAFYPLYSQTAEVSVTAGSYIRAYALDPANFKAWNQMKIVLGTSASQVAQVANDVDFQVSMVDLTA